MILCCVVCSEGVASKRVCVDLLLESGPALVATEFSVSTFKKTKVGEHRSEWKTSKAQIAAWGAGTAIVRPMREALRKTLSGFLLLCLM